MCVCVCRSYAPWCPACKKFEPVWSEFGEWANELNVRVAKVDVTAESGNYGNNRYVKHGVVMVR